MSGGKQYENPAQMGSDRPKRASTGPQMTEPGPDGRDADVDSTESELNESQPRSRKADMEQDESTSGTGERR
jgi:hypothetical protein